MKLVKPAQFNQPVPYIIRLPYPAARVKAVVTVIILDTNHIELYGAITQEAVGRTILEAGLARLSQFHKDQRSPIVGLDGEPLPAANSQEGEA